MLEFVTSGKTEVGRKRFFFFQFVTWIIFVFQRKYSSANTIIVGTAISRIVTHSYGEKDFTAF